MTRHVQSRAEKLGPQQSPHAEIVRQKHLQTRKRGAMLRASQRKMRPSLTARKHMANEPHRGFFFRLFMPSCAFNGGLGGGAVRLAGCRVCRSVNPVQLRHPQLTVEAAVHPQRTHGGIMPSKSQSLRAANVAAIGGYTDEPLPVPSNIALPATSGPTSCSRGSHCPSNAVEGKKA